MTTIPRSMMDAAPRDGSPLDGGPWPGTALQVVISWRCLARAIDPAAPLATDLDVTLCCTVTPRARRADATGQIVVAPLGLGGPSAVSADEPTTLHTPRLLGPITMHGQVDVDGRWCTIQLRDEGSSGLSLIAVFDCSSRDGTDATAPLVYAHGNMFGVLGVPGGRYGPARGSVAPARTSGPRRSLTKSAARSAMSPHRC